MNASITLPRICRLASLRGRSLVLLALVSLTAAASGEEPRQRPIPVAR